VLHQLTWRGFPMGPRSAGELQISKMDCEADGGLAVPASTDECGLIRSNGVMPIEAFGIEGKLEKGFPLRLADDGVAALSTPAWLYWRGVVSPSHWLWFGLFRPLP